MRKERRKRKGKREGKEKEKEKKKEKEIFFLKKKVEDLLFFHCFKFAGYLKKGEGTKVEKLIPVIPNYATYDFLML